MVVRNVFGQFVVDVASLASVKNNICDSWASCFIAVSSRQNACPSVRLSQPGNVSKQRNILLIYQGHIVGPIL